MVHISFSMLPRKCFIRSNDNNMNVSFHERKVAQTAIHSIEKGDVDKSEDAGSPSRGLVQVSLSEREGSIKSDYKGSG